MFMRKVSIVAISLFFLTSCETAQLNRETVTAEENSVAESLFEDIQLSVDDNAKALNDTSAVGELQWSGHQGRQSLSKCGMDPKLGWFEQFLEIPENHYN